MSGEQIAGDGCLSSNRARHVAMVTVCDLDGSMFFIPVNSNSTVADFRAAITSPCAVYAEHQLLIYNGRIMTDDQTLESLGIANGDTVYLIRYDDATTVNAHAMEQRVEELFGNLANSNMSALENLGDESLCILYANVSHIRTICERNLGVLEEFGLRNPSINHFPYQIPHPRPQRQFPHNPHFPLQTPQGVHQLLPQTAQNIYQGRVNFHRGQASGSGTAHNDEGTSTSAAGNMGRGMQNSGNRPQC